MKTYLLSYPRSGNTWARYIIEYLSKRPTQGYDNPGDKEIGKRSNIGVDLDAEPIVIKSHNELGTPSDGLLVILRDYNEVLSRHAKSGGLNSPKQMKDHFIDQTQGLEKTEKVDYIGLLDNFNNFKGKKLLIYYEDLMKTPKVEIDKIVDFLNIGKEHIKEFFDNYESHKKSSIKTYQDKSYTSGNRLDFHSSTMSKEYITFMTKHLKDNHPDVFSKYLSRYSRD